MDQTCVFEENKSGYHKILERNSMGQICFAIHKPSREGGGIEPNLRPPCSTDFENIDQNFTIFLIFEVVIVLWHDSDRSCRDLRFEPYESYYMTLEVINL